MPKLTVIVVADVSTLTYPEPGVGVSPPTDGTRNGNVPFVSRNARVEVVVDFVTPFTVTDQRVPLGSPLSMKVIVNSVVVKLIDVETGIPSTVTLPRLGVGLNTP